MKKEGMIYLTDNFINGDHWARCYLLREWFHIRSGDPMFCLGGNINKPVSPKAAKEHGYVLDDNLMKLLIESNDIFNCISIEEVGEMIFKDSRDDSNDSNNEYDDYKESIPF